MADEIKPIKFTLNGKEIDLTSALPLTIGDIKALKLSGLDLMKINQDSMELEQVINLLLFICNKVNKDVTAADIESMPLPWMKRLSAVLFVERDNEIPF